MKRDFKIISSIVITSLFFGILLTPAITSDSIKTIESQDIFLKNTASDIEKELHLVYGKHLFYIYALEDVVSFNLIHCIPLIYEDQVPVLLYIGNQTTANILSYKIESDIYSPNKVINLTIGRMNKGEKTTIHLEYWVLIKNNEFDDLPDYVAVPKEYELPEETKMFLDATKSVQSGNALIKLKAKRLLGKSDGNLLKYAENVVTYTRRNRVIRSPLGLELGFEIFSFGLPTVLYHMFPKKLSNLKKYDFEIGNMDLITTESMYNDALSTYFLGGQCTGVSNLGAALFRSNGIPAKQLIVNSDKKSKLTQSIIHYMCEYYCPGYGWIRADSRFKFASTPIPYNESVILKVIYTEDENMAGSGIKGNGGLVPWFWTTNDNIVRGKTREWCWNEGFISTTENVANDTLELTQNVWELSIRYSGKDLNVQDQQYFNNAIVAQQNAINCFKLLDYNGFFDNITTAYNEYLKLDHF